MKLDDGILIEKALLGVKCDGTYDCKSFQSTNCVMDTTLLCLFLNGKKPNEKQFLIWVQHLYSSLLILKLKSVFFLYSSKSEPEKRWHLSKQNIFPYELKVGIKFQLKENIQ